MTIKQTNATPEEAATETARQSTPEIIAERERKSDEDVIRSAMAMPLAYLFVELVDQLVDDGTIQPTDFSEPQRTAYKNLKSSVDRIKPGA